VSMLAENLWMGAVGRFILGLDQPGVGKCGEEVGPGYTRC